MLTDKSEILRTLKALAAFDKGSPYVAAQFPQGGKPQFHRCSANGFIQTKGYSPLEPSAYVSLAHFLSNLRLLPEDNIELGLDANGTLRIYGTSSDIFESEATVLTVSPGQAGLMKHETGEPVTAVVPSTFSGINVRPFTFSTVPVTALGRLMINTNAAATVFWDSAALSSLPDVYPREPFLRAVSDGAPVQDMAVTSNDYWAASVADMAVYIKGHKQNRQIFDKYNVPTQELAKLPAERLVVALGSAVGLLEANEAITLDPRLGVVASDKYGTGSRNSLGAAGDWPKFTVAAATAKVIHDALAQGEGDEVVLASAPSPIGGTAFRLRRGAFEVNFRPASVK